MGELGVDLVDIVNTVHQPKLHNLGRNRAHLEERLGEVLLLPHRIDVIRHDGQHPCWRRWEWRRCRWWW